jgi:hypothetical protein
MLSQSAIVEAAVMSFLSQDGADRRAAACTRRLEPLIRQIRRLERNNGPRDDPAGTNQTILFAAVCTRHPAISVFLVDLIRFVLFPYPGMRRTRRSRASAGVVEQFLPNRRWLRPAFACL